jgi:hypothetical protein
MGIYCTESESGRYENLDPDPDQNRPDPQHLYAHFSNFTFISAEPYENERSSLHFSSSAPRGLYVLLTYSDKKQDAQLYRFQVTVVQDGETIKKSSKMFNNL